ncbi:MAG: pilus assembly PilX N-terminal domain-containing protein [Mariprofundaceae bacterium]
MKTDDKEQGFVLITSLVILLILTIMSVGLYFRSTTNQQVSTSGQNTTRAYYFAETALNYVSWSLHSAQNNDADLDGDGNGDRSNLQADTTDPTTQVSYFDNRAITARRIAYNPANTVNPPVVYDPSTNATPDFDNIAGNLPAGYLVLAIADNGAITLTVTSTVPANHYGAVVWLTAADQTTFADSVAGNSYDVVAYSIGYVNGKPLRMLRAIIGNAGMGPPVGLGSVTNGYQ